MDRLSPSSRHRRAPSRRSGRAGAVAGFTLLELMIVVAIAGVLAAIALPSLGPWMERERATTFASRLAMALSNARADAVKFGTPVILCASDTGERCDTRWNAGWMAFRDDDRDGAFGAADEVLFVGAARGGRSAVTVSALDGPLVRSIRFDYRGYPERAATATIATGTGDVRVELNPVGRAEIR